MRPQLVRRVNPMTRKTRAYFQIVIREKNQRDRLLTRDIPDGPIPDVDEFVVIEHGGMCIPVRNRTWMNDGHIQVDLGYLFVRTPEDTLADAVLPRGWNTWSPEQGYCLDEMRDAGWGSP